MSTFDWSCPFCNRHATITQYSTYQCETRLQIDNADGHHKLTSVFVVCPNPKCKKFTLKLSIAKCHFDTEYRAWVDQRHYREWQLIPESNAQVFPDYVPQAVRIDYNEACLIAKLSPKASATLARRCMQGILRDFWKVKPGRLVDEIEAIKDRVDPLTWEAIEAVRKVGNIGAHMEKDINTIVEVEPHEADLLIGLIETLIKDWYISREDKQIRLTAISKLAREKDGAKNKGE